MQLVEVVKTDELSSEVYEELMAVCAKMRKRAVTCKDTPG
jgi:3-hydroxyacyl-CoA dehydrogenase